MDFQPQAAVASRSIASFEDYLEAVRKRKYLAFGITLGVLALSMLYTSRQVAAYSASARIGVSPTPVGSTNQSSLVAPNLEREAALLVSDGIATAARAAVSADGTATWGTVRAFFKPFTDVIDVKATSTDPTTASKLASAYAAEYVARRVAAQTAFYATETAELTAQLAAVEARLAKNQIDTATVDRRRQDVSALAGSAARSVELEAISSDRSQLATQVSFDQSQVRTIENTLAATRREQVTQLPAATVISAAAQPTSPNGLDRRIFWIVGGLIGLALGIIAAFLRERLDRSAQSARQVELALGGKVIGAIPRFGWRNRREKWALVMAQEGESGSLMRSQEAFRRLRSSVMFLARGENVRSIVVTSHRPQEGKSTVAVNLAMALSLGGADVVLVSADLRRPSLERTLGLDNDRGLTTYLRGSNESLRRETIDGFPNLTVIPSGPDAGNPGELLGSPRFAAIIRSLEAEADLGISDTAPLAAAADALSAAEAAGGIIIVVDGHGTETTDLLAMRNELDRSGARLVGAVLNRDRSQSASVFSRRKKYGYYSERVARGARNTPVPLEVDADLAHSL